ncbi:hypothetical protein [Paraburkholderia fungorum]|uniref:hypothetical protein n=1 Tax=Paraburkholderia fungorum TaxID=134537 RepID=UPI0038B9A4F4
MGSSQAIVFRIGLARRFQLKGDWQAASFSQYVPLFIMLSSAQRNAAFIGDMKPDKTAQAASDQVLG